TNVAGTALIVEEARRAGARAFVHVSSPAVAHAGRSLIGAPPGAADPRATRGHYATSKAMAEILALGASSAAMPVVAIRPHLVWGPGDTQLIGRVVDRARSGRLALVGSGTALVDTTYVDNAASALATAHWFDQRETRAALRWEPAVSLAEGFARLAAWFRSRQACGA